ncbi:hypothetical protein [Candidatus Lucifugimonas marina]|uniref:Uncharacterized protein n=1 Tax=Candidatus Lucifugimonas marina TaxID=3038979 RepID=A0AAJ6CW55_9CHLR|nr:hypothetical protein [SAR202 cluster bacterium JH702]MDG0869289.1 hypothetical protein [SAR202 cluster bacterium JH639]WFG36691.1 hypothetical protein GKN94_13730 [SAR202 cluster bacterium JH545]WFG40625.1 hypothetical protein GKO48_13775 [SAR202 cluster bacterium JH1073]
MGTAVVSLFAFFLVIGTTMTAVNTVLNTGSDNAQALAAKNELLVAELESSIELVSATAATGGGVTQVDVVLSNDGMRTFSSYDDWDVSVRYDQTGGSDETVLLAPYSASTTDNSWTDLSFWLDYDNSIAELIEPGRINQHEEMVLRIQLNPEVQASTSGEVKITTPSGQTGTIYFSGS